LLGQSDEVEEGGFLWVVLDPEEVPLAESSVMKLMKCNEVDEV
jgi:hypothetical protein